MRDELGIEDAWPVVAEPFFQWVLEDDHPAGRPSYEQADVQLVEPYELMKLRLLNASHQGLCYFGYLSGYRYAHEATQDEAIASFLRRYMDEEGTPTLHPVPGIDLDDYKATLIERFRNPEVRDTLARLCAESSDRIPKWLLPVVRANLAADRPVTLSAGIVASWARYAEGTDEDGQPIQVVDRLADRLTAAAQEQHEDRLAFLRDRQVFGDLVDDERFVAAYHDALDRLLQPGAHATVTRLAQIPPVFDATSSRRQLRQPTHPELSITGLNRSSMSTAFCRTVTAIAAQIADVEAGSMRRLPSERRLAESLNVSRPTARRALQHLQQQGIIIAAIGKGYYVAEPPQEESSSSS